MVLTQLQRRVWRALAALPEADTFALAGGAAMITLGLVERETTDLDLFGTRPEHLERLGTVVDDTYEQLKDWVRSTYDAVTEPTPERSPKGPSLGL